MPALLVCAHTIQHFLLSARESARVRAETNRPADRQTEESE